MNWEIVNTNMQRKYKFAVVIVANVERSKFFIMRRALFGLYCFLEHAPALTGAQRERLKNNYLQHTDFGEAAKLAYVYRDYVLAKRMADYFFHDIENKGGRNVGIYSKESISKIKNQFFHKG